MLGSGLGVLDQADELCEGVFVEVDAKGLVRQEDVKGAGHLWLRGDGKESEMADKTEKNV